jgi:VanZ family protein
MRQAHPTLHRLRKPILILCILAWVGAFGASHIPAGEISKIKLPSDGLLHAAGFGVIGTLLLLSLAAFGVSRLRRVWLTVGALAMYGALDENTQPFVNRTCDINDWYADMTGMLIAVVVVEIVLLIIERRRAATKKLR